MNTIKHLIAGFCLFLLLGGCAKRSNVRELEAFSRGLEGKVGMMKLNQDSFCADFKELGEQMAGEMIELKQDNAEILKILKELENEANLMAK